MKIILAADHRGFELKEHIKTWLRNEYEVVDCGAMEYDKEDDYVDFGKKAVLLMEADDKAILLCGSGHGMDIVANRYEHVRAVIGFNTDVAKQGREHEDANVLVLPADWMSGDEAQEVVRAFVETSFSGEEKHLRRLEKLKELFS